MNQTEEEKWTMSQDERRQVHSDINSMQSEELEVKRWKMVLWDDFPRKSSLT